ncbi:uncharacterized protein LY79DRAFT_71666 [Colletotrichum navitas]|uniref:Uncharacterized protein n=1 Tax=Colletotrichum navitas TaxID=681940 RepID=A0AAD8PLR1_9PEZI|nr:uncharacterized protein LY79DRAFT_71666 [Colletotrichum navitas]KAK1569634.1 hypothetical protein LY79DRAFT_71666 [Colletotrichum navitas]
MSHSGQDSPTGLSAANPGAGRLLLPLPLHVPATLEPPVNSPGPGSMCPRFLQPRVSTSHPSTPPSYPLTKIQLQANCTLEHSQQRQPEHEALSPINPNDSSHALHTQSPRILAPRRLNPNYYQQATSTVNIKNNAIPHFLHGKADAKAKVDIHEARRD